MTRHQDIAGTIGIARLGNAALIRSTRSPFCAPVSPFWRCASPRVVGGHADDPEANKPQLLPAGAAAGDYAQPTAITSSNGTQHELSSAFPGSGKSGIAPSLWTYDFNGVKVSDARSRPFRPDQKPQKPR
jgi:hypothetical protein